MAAIFTEARIAIQLCCALLQLIGVAVVVGSLYDDNRPFAIFKLLRNAHSRFAAAPIRLSRTIFIAASRLEGLLQTDARNLTTNFRAKRNRQTVAGRGLN